LEENTMTSASQGLDDTWPVGRRQMVTAITASSLGWALDLFDLFILLYVAPVIGKLFFPSEFPTLSLAAVYASFAVTLLMRPFGSALFGSYADRYGRRGAMIAAVIGVGVATALFGALPTIDQVGIAAPVLFLVLRLIQGLFVGGVVASTHTIGTESVPPWWRGAMSGLIGGGGAGIGALIASLVYFITTEIFPGDLFAVWGWRCMFFSGIISSILGFFIFSGLEESPVWAALKARRDQDEDELLRAPVRALFSRQYLPVLLVNLMMTIGGGAGYYLTSGYLPAFLKVVAKMPNDTASLILISASVTAIVASVLAGHLSTLWGRKPTLLALALMRIVLLPLCYVELRDAQDVGSVALFSLVLTFFGNAGYAPLLIFLNERFPTALRSTGTGLSWNIGFAIGGMMPTFVSLFAPTPGDLPEVLAIFTFGVSAVFLAGACIIPETRGNLKL
jgi:MFS transporter, MHS family, proline/betaine transporter